MTASGASRFFSMANQHERLLCVCGTGPAAATHPEVVRHLLHRPAAVEHLLNHREVDGDAWPATRGGSRSRGCWSR